MAATLELQKAVFTALGSDVALTGLLGGARIYDHAPANVPFPYVTFGRASLRDWGTATENGSEHLFSIHVWSRAKGRSEAVSIMDAIRQILHDGALILAGHSLINLRRETHEIRFDDDHRVHHGTLQFRAVTEPAG